jgi:L-seryl-tRNA(Ser) seleniumtransferase
MARALRVDKLTLAALEATLALYREPTRAVREIPALAMLTAHAASIRERAESLRELLAAVLPDLRVEPSEATVGGGAYPSARIPSFALTLGGDVEGREARLRRSSLPIIGTVRNGRLRLDLRSVPAKQDALLAERLRSLGGPT